MRTIDRWLLAAAIWSAVLIFSDFPDWGYQLSKWGLTSVAGIAAWHLWRAGARQSVIPLAATAAVFNPIAPISFDEDEWRLVDGLAAIAFLLYVKNIQVWISSHRRAVGAAIAVLSLAGLGVLWKEDRRKDQSRLRSEMQQRALQEEWKRRQAESEARRVAISKAQDEAAKQMRQKREWEDWKRRNNQ